MKKILVLFLLFTLCVGCTKQKEEEIVVTEPEKVEVINTVDVTEMAFDPTLYEFMDQKDDLTFVEISLEDSLRIFSEKGSGVIIWGYSTCYWCNRAMPELNKVAVDLGVKVYYVDANKGATDEEFMQLKEALDPVLEEDEDGEKVIYVPQMVAVKNGEIVGGHLSLVDSYDEEVQDQLTDEQKEELQGIYRDIILRLAH